MINVSQGEKTKRAAFYTLGCKVNRYETEAMAEIFEKAGYEIVDFERKADVYIINTCTVTGLSARKSRQAIRKAKSINRGAVVAVVGCYPQTSPEEVCVMPEVDIIAGTKDRGRLPEFVREFEACGQKVNAVGNIMRVNSFEDLNIERYRDRTRAFLKIQDGCSRFCTYCIIPYARGPVRSRLPEDVLAEVKKLAEGGFREIVLTGIHIASYGKDLGNTSLLRLIKEIHEIEGISRIRLGSVEPTTITVEFTEAARDMGKLCPHYHISLQSGCNQTLKRMNRKYTTDDYKMVVEHLREKIADVSITTDVMVGFPGETDDEFEMTFAFLEGIPFTKMHVFKYSPRKGTPAASFPGQVDGRVKEERSKRILALSERKTLEFNSRFLGRVLPVLFEQEYAPPGQESTPFGKECTPGEGFMEGLTPNYIRVACKGIDSLRGNIAGVRLEKTEGDHVEGTIVDAVAICEEI